jgi:glycerophosphoryl diester phosphodiesterase
LPANFKRHMNRSTSFFKKTFKVLLYTLLIVAGIYLTFMFAFGGYGKKPITLTMPTNNNGHIFFAHRAMSGYYPESSLSAVKGAKDEGLNGVELDIQKDRNGELIIFHDESCERLLGFKGLIDTMTLAEIKKYPLIFQEKVKSDSYVISVKELLDNYSNKLLFYFDMKLTDFKTADDMVKLIRHYGIEKSCIVANSDFPFVFYIEHTYPEITTVLEGFDAGKEWTYYLMPKNLKPDFFSGFSWNLDAAHVAWLKKHDLVDRRIVYGVGIDNIKTMLNYGLKHLIVDYDTAMRHVVTLR